MSGQDQFLDVIDRDEAERRFRTALSLQPLGRETLRLHDALGRILARNVIARLDVPAFDRSNFDGYAVQAKDTEGAGELVPRTIRLLSHSLEAGVAAEFEILPGQAASISTGGMLPRGADAVVMVEHAEEYEGSILVRRAVTPGTGVSFTGTDISQGETVLRAGTVLTSRETGVLAALGEVEVQVWRQPRVTIISTGNEIIAPGQPLRTAGVYDSNSQVLADAVREQGGIPIFGGIVRDDVEQLRTAVRQALAESDVVLLSGGTSKGRGDLCYRVVAEFNDPGIVVHGVALKPGKPICMAVTSGKPVVILPGFPTSAIFTFHEFVAPVLRILGGKPVEEPETVQAKLALRTNSEIGRTEYLLVGLVKTDDGFSAFPMGKGSGSVTTFSRADGFVTIPRHTEIVEAGEQVHVELIGRGLQIPDLVVIGSHCVGLDWLLSELQLRGISSRLLTVGSSGGLSAAKRGECDIAPVHLLDAATGVYNRAFLDTTLSLTEGYRRSQGIVFRRGDSRFEGRSLEEILPGVIGDSTLAMVNRNQGSGTRILIDRLLGGRRPAGYAVQPGTHSAVAAAVLQKRADWGVAIEAVARANELGFIAIQDEHYDFVIPESRRQRPAVLRFLELLREAKTLEELSKLRLRR